MNSVQNDYLKFLLFDRREFVKTDGDKIDYEELELISEILKILEEKQN